MSKGDSARKAYEIAKHETFYRIRLRDHVLLFYLAAIGTILGVSLGSSGNEVILLSVPYLGLGASILVSQHNAVIGFLGHFCAEEIVPFLENIEEQAPTWDMSESLKEYSLTSARLRTWGHSLIIVIPCLLSLAINWKHGFFSTFPEIVVWWFGALCIIALVLIIFFTHNSRMFCYNKRDWNSKDHYINRKSNQ